MQQELPIPFASLDELMSQGTRRISTQCESHIKQMAKQSGQALIKQIFACHQGANGSLIKSIKPSAIYSFVLVV